MDIREFVDYAAFDAYLVRKFGTNDFASSWVVGGLAGGNCWGDGGHYELEAEPEPAFEALDDILGAVCPDLRYTEFRKLNAEGLFEDSTKSHREYYGNYSTVRTKRLNIEVLFERLREIVGERAI